MLSDISLNDISIIAVFRLPITLDDINKFGPGLTFEALLSEQALRVVSSQPEINPPQNQVPTNQTQASNNQTPIKPTMVITSRRVDTSRTQNKKTESRVQNKGITTSLK
jgi:hypothetical protein